MECSSGTWHQNWFVSFQDIVLTALVTDR